MNKKLENNSTSESLSELCSAMLVINNAKDELLKPTTTAFLHMMRGLKENCPTIYKSMFDESLTKLEDDSKLNLNELLRLSLEPNKVFEIVSNKLDEIAQDKLCGKSLFDQQELKDYSENLQPFLPGIASCEELNTDERELD